MTPKQAKLERVKIIYDQIVQAEKELEDLRTHFAGVVKEASATRATQQQIADQTSLSRQRIQQLLVD